MSLSYSRSRLVAGSMAALRDSLITLKVARTQDAQSRQDLDAKVLQQSPYYLVHKHVRTYLEVAMYLGSSAKYLVVLTLVITYWTRVMWWLYRVGYKQ